MSSFANNLNTTSFNSLDPTTFLYLNPIFQHEYSNSIEKTFVFMTSNAFTDLGYLITNKTFEYENFDHDIYYHHTSNQIHDYFYDDANGFEALFYFDRTETKRMIDIYVSTFGIDPDIPYSIDSNFNPEIYKLFHKIIQPMTTQELYIDYLKERTNSNIPFTIGNLQELSFMIRSNVTLEFSDLVVREDGYVMNTLYVKNEAHIDGGMHIYGDGSNLVVGGGGGLVVDATYNNIDSALDNQSSEDPLNIVFSWIPDFQHELNLSGFTNDIAPWLTANVQDIYLSQFSNDIAPWLENVTSITNYADDEITLFESQSTRLNLGYLGKPIHEITAQHIYILDSFETWDGNIKSALSVGNTIYSSNVFTSNLTAQNIVILDGMTVEDTLSVGSNIYTSNIETSSLATERLFTSNEIVTNMLSVGSNIYTSNIETSSLATEHLFTSNEIVTNTLSVGSNVFASNIETYSLTTYNGFTSNMSASNSYISESISVGDSVYSDHMHVKSNVFIGGILTLNGLLVINGGTIEIGSTDTTGAASSSGESVNVNYSIEAVNYTATFDISWNTLSETDKRNFEHEFKSSVANSLGVSIDDVVIHTITQGSAIVNSSVYLSSTTTTVSNITEKLNNPTDMFSLGPIFGYKSPTIQNIVHGVSKFKGEIPKKQASSPIVIIGDITDTTVIINWISGDNGDSIVTKYVVLANNEIVVDDILSTENTRTIINLLPNMSYIFTVRKVTDIGSYDSSGLYLQKRKLYTAGRVLLTGQTSELTNIGYGYADGFGDDVQEVYRSASDWVVIRTFDGTFYSFGRDRYNTNRLGRLDENGLMYNEPDVYLTNRQPNDILNNSKIEIKSIALIHNACVVLTIEGKLMFYGHIMEARVNTELVDLIGSVVGNKMNVVDDLMSSGWTIENIYGLHKSFVVHLKKENNVDKIRFVGYDHDFQDSDGINTQLDILLSYGGQIEDIHGLHKLLRIKIDGIWYGIGLMNESYSEGTSWGEESRAYEGASDPLQPGVSQYNCSLIKLDILNNLLTDKPGSFLINSSIDALCVYQPSTGDFYMMSSVPGDMQFGPDLSVHAHTFRLVPEMNLNNMGVENTYLENVIGEFDQFVTWWKVGGFLTKKTLQLLPDETVYT